MPTKLGQNFLKDPVVLENIIRSSDIHDVDFVVEIGPGEGILTERLARSEKRIIAIELDDNLIPILQNKFSSFENVAIIHADILKINLPELIGSAEKYKLIANIPYYITSPIIRLFLEQLKQPEEMILMVQKEVAERIAAPKGQMSLLAVSVQYYAAAEILFTVDKKSFSPVPRVDSAVIRIAPRKKFYPTEDKKFFRVVKAGFSAKRKTLLNNLSSGLQIEKDLMEKALLAANISCTARAQELSIDDWKALENIINA
jgi:16S rRNA (adenine1518-N6/adenine1519-N6)-dimethyltransferase